MKPFQILVFCLFLIFQSCSPALPTTVFLVRHAEKEKGEDPHLSPAGQERARRLAQMLKEVKLHAVYSTDTQRTLETATPIAQAQGLSIVNYSLYPDSSLIDSVLQHDLGKTVLIVGHSNTVPDLVRYFGAPLSLKKIDDSDYENIFLVTVSHSQKRKKEARILHLKF